MIELIVEENPIRESDECWKFVVRSATDISKGDHLLEAVPYSVKDGIVTEAAAFSVDLLVDRICSWGKDWDIVYAGMTARIFVKGDASKISARTFLRSG